MSLFPKVGRKQGSARIIWWTVVGVLCFGVFLHLLPFYFMIITSFKSGPEVFFYPPTLWPQHPTLAAWQLLWQVATLLHCNGVVAGGKTGDQEAFCFRSTDARELPIDSDRVAGRTADLKVPGRRRLRQCW